MGRLNTPSTEQSLFTELYAHVESQLMEAISYKGFGLYRPHDNDVTSEGFVWGGSSMYISAKI